MVVIRHTKNVLLASLQYDWNHQIDQRIDGVPQAVVEEESMLTRVDHKPFRTSSSTSPKKEELMQELCCSRWRKICSHESSVKQIVHDQGNVEAYELCALTHKMQGEHCTQYVTLIQVLEP